MSAADAAAVGGTGIPAIYRGSISQRIAGSREISLEREREGARVEIDRVSPIQLQSRSEKENRSSVFSSISFLNQRI